MATIIYRKLKNGTIKRWITPGNFRNAKVKKNCQNCGKNIFPYFSELKLGYGKFCSKSCANLAMKGKSMNTGRTHFKKGMIPWNKGKIYHTGKPSGMLGKKQSEEFKKNRKNLWLGEDNPNWNNGASKLKRYVHYKTAEYKKWRESVFKRDEYTCQKCGKKGCYIHPHHLKSYTFFPEVRYAIGNGLTLCVPCHRQTHFGH